MEMRPDHPSYPANWAVRFVCDCANKQIELHQGVTQKIALDRVRILSDHPVCVHKRIALQLMLPDPEHRSPYRIVKIIGHTIATRMRAGHFLTEIDFDLFEEDGKKALEQKLLEFTLSDLPSPYALTAGDMPQPQRMTRSA